MKFGHRRMIVQNGFDAFQTRRPKSPHCRLSVRLAEASQARADALTARPAAGPLASALIGKKGKP